MAIVETSVGALDVDVESVNDYEFIEQLAELDGGNVLALPRILKTLLGNEQHSVVKDAIRGENGRIDPAKAVDIVSEIMTKAGETAKN